MSLGISEIILILLAILILFGGKKLPELARIIARVNYEYKKARYAIQKEVNEFKAEIDVKSEKPVEYNPLEQNKDAQV